MQCNHLGKIVHHVNDVFGGWVGWERRRAKKGKSVLLAGWHAWEETREKRTEPTKRPWGEGGGGFFLSIFGSSHAHRGASHPWSIAHRYTKLLNSQIKYDDFCRSSLKSKRSKVSFLFFFFFLGLEKALVKHVPSSCKLQELVQSQFWQRIIQQRLKNWLTQLATRTETGWHWRKMPKSKVGKDDSM